MLFQEKIIQMIKNNKNLIYLFSIISFSCYTPIQQEKCISNYTQIIYNTNNYKEIRKAAIDTVKNWANIDNWYFRRLQITKWQIDSSVFFNEMNTKGILMLLQIDNDSNAILDGVQLMIAENKNQKWHFYLNGLPYIGFNRKKSNLNRAFTFDELSKRTTIRLIKGGLLNKWKCSINEDYINGWFDSNMDKKHIEFLNEKIQ